jgi:hypothetical protein
VGFPRHACSTPACTGVLEYGQRPYGAVQSSGAGGPEDPHSALRRRLQFPSPRRDGSGPATPAARRHIWGNDKNSELTSVDDEFLVGTYDHRNINLSMLKGTR